MTASHLQEQPIALERVGNSTTEPPRRPTCQHAHAPATATALVDAVRGVAARLDQGLSHDLVVDRLRACLSEFAAADLPTQPTPWRASYGRYPRILLNDPSDTFQLVLVLWPPGGRSAIHDHDETVGGVVALWGELVETKYYARRIDGRSVALRSSARSSLRRGDFTPILPEEGLQLHDMVNEGLGWGATLHVYLRAIVDFHSYTPTLGGRYRERAHAFWFDYEDGAATWDAWASGSARTSDPAHASHVAASDKVAHEGGCACGAVTVRVHGAPALQLACHCTDCRRSTGDPVTAWTFFPTDAVEIGGEALRSERYVNDSGYAVTKDACARCGSLVRFSSDLTPQLRGVRAQVLAASRTFEPELDLYLSSSTSPNPVPTSDTLQGPRLRRAPKLAA